MRKIVISVLLLSVLVIAGPISNGIASDKPNYSETLNFEKSWTDFVSHCAEVNASSDRLREPSCGE